MSGIGKTYGNLSALRNVKLTVRQGEVTCLLGDNGAGKSTLISIIAGLFPHDEGEYLVDGHAARFSSPREALDRGSRPSSTRRSPSCRSCRCGAISSSASELTRGRGPFLRLDLERMWSQTRNELHRMGIDLEDLEQPVGTLSGGQRQAVAIARAIHFGARVLILDEPTAALGVAQSGLVLRYVSAAAREHGIGVIFITHIPHHAYLVGDNFMVLARGEVDLDDARSDLSLENLMFHMAGGSGTRGARARTAGSPGGACALTAAPISPAAPCWPDHTGCRE